MFESAKWGRIYAILGFIGSGLSVLFMVWFGTNADRIYDYRRYGTYGDALTEQEKAAMIFVLTCGIIGTLLYLIACSYLWKYSNLMRKAMTTGDEASLTSSFRYLKILFRYIAILTIIGMSLFFLFLLLGVVGSNQ